MGRARVRRLTRAERGIFSVARGRSCSGFGWRLSDEENFLLFDEGIVCWHHKPNVGLPYVSCHSRYHDENYDLGTLRKLDAMIDAG